jgi:nucleotide-binding universal stress UspA family protein
MTYRTILAHFGDARRFDGVLAPAIALARRFEAHLKGLAVLPPLIVEPSLTPGAAGGVVIDSHRKAFAEDCQLMKQRFETAVRDSGVIGEWVMDDADPWPVRRKVLEHARVADLVIAAQAEVEEFPLAAMRDGPEELVLGAGRPVLILPKSGNHAELGRRVVVAWNGRREAARAAFDALPLLARAEAVRVLWITPDDRGGQSAIPGADLAAALARHKVRSEAAETVRLEAGVGETLLKAVRDARADLLVMGCFGHSRFRELVLGGATRHVLRETAVPVLMSH